MSTDTASCDRNHNYSRGGLAEEGVGFQNRLVFFFFAFVELLGEIILYANVGDGM
jgi:hypothetical protein